MDTATKKELNEILMSLMEAHGITLERLMALTGIPKRFLVALVEGDFKKLPAKPYVRGYLMKIAEVLEVKQEVLIQAYKESNHSLSSGGEDVLPYNRFALKSLTWRNIILLGLAGALFIYLGLRSNYILGLPTITITYPDTDLVKTQTIVVRGSITPGDELKLNKEVVYTGEDGLFRKEIALEPGLNTLEFTVKRFLGREIKVVKQITYIVSK